KELQREVGITFIFVTHDQHEAFAVADRIAVLAEGRLQQWGTAMDLYHRPANRFVAGFIGEGVMLSGVVDAQGYLLNALGKFRSEQLGACLKAGDQAEMLVRPDDIQHDDDSPLKARVVSKAFRGAQFLYTLALPAGQHLISLVPSRARSNAGTATHAAPANAPNTKTSGTAKRAGSESANAMPAQAPPIMPRYS
ncbi:MAG: TOBE domain-containing protein, partial [Actinobacteria bacterium]|nr:TOBE domain-containing protein [Actinomycetota bacterium]